MIEPLKANDSIQQPYISLIIPFYMKNMDGYIYTRVCKLIEMSYPDNIEVVFVDSTKSSEISIHIKTLCEASQIKYIHSNQPGGYSLGRARNKGAVKASGKFLFFMDIDFIFSDIFWDTLFQKITLELEGSDNYYKFLMLPCLYLNKKTTQKIGNDKTWKTFEKIRNNALEGDITYIDKIAVSSSTIVLRRKYFLQLGGFNTTYIGHGREEFDLLHRLSINYPIGKRPNDYNQDKVHHFPANYKGFRRYFVYYALPFLFEPLFLLHLYHSRPQTNIFYKNRKRNEKKFQTNIRKYNSGNSLPPLGRESLPKTPIHRLDLHPLLTMSDFIKQLLQKNGFNPVKYCGLRRYKLKIKVLAPIIVNQINRPLVKTFQKTIFTLKKQWSN